MILSGAHKNFTHPMQDHISVTIPTFRRDEMLSRLLHKLALQKTNDLFDFSIVVVDNDKAGTAQNIVKSVKAELAVVIDYDIEPERNIAAARNHALRLARGNYIGIIDDDEIPPPHWLVTLYNAIHLFEVDGALGPVHPFFVQQPPAWLLKGGFCERPVHRTGTLLQWHQTRTGNVLLKREVFEKYHLSFDENFKTGGSDQQFFKQAMGAGCRFVAVEEAPVYEIVLPERMQKSYYLKRAMVNGYNAHKYDVHKNNILALLIVPLKSIIALVIYMIILPVAALLGSYHVIKYLEKGLHHTSRLFAMLGIELVKRRTF